MASGDSEGAAAAVAQACEITGPETLIDYRALFGIRNEPPRPLREFAQRAGLPVEQCPAGTFPVEFQHQAPAGSAAQITYGGVGDADLVSSDGQCLTVAAGATDPKVLFSVSREGGLTLTSDASGRLEAFVAQEGDAFTQDQVVAMQASPGTVWLSIEVPEDSTLRLRIDPPSGSTFTICGDYR
jgi:hypothetical protein